MEERLLVLIKLQRRKLHHGKLLLYNCMMVLVSLTKHSPKTSRQLMPLPKPKKIMRNNGSRNTKTLPLKSPTLPKIRNWQTSEIEKEFTKTTGTERTNGALSFSNQMTPKTQTILILSRLESARKKKKLLKLEQWLCPRKMKLQQRIKLQLRKKLLLMMLIQRRERNQRTQMVLYKKIRTLNLLKLLIRLKIKQPRQMDQTQEIRKMMPKRKSQKKRRKRKKKKKMMLQQRTTKMKAKPTK